MLARETARRGWRPITAGVALLVVVGSGLLGLPFGVVLVALLAVAVAYPRPLLGVVRAVLPGGRRG